jgi:hypothetical protein
MIEPVEQTEMNLLEPPYPMKPKAYLRWCLDQNDVIWADEMSPHFAALPSDDSDEGDYDSDEGDYDSDESDDEDQNSICIYQPRIEDENLRRAMGDELYELWKKNLENERRYMEERALVPREQVYRRTYIDTDFFARHRHLDRSPEPYQRQYGVNVDGLKVVNENLIRSIYEKIKPLHEQKKRVCDQLKRRIKTIDNQLWEIEKKFDPIDHDFAVIMNEWKRRRGGRFYDSEKSLRRYLKFPPDRLGGGYRDPCGYRWIYAPSPWSYRDLNDEENIE